MRGESGLLKLVIMKDKHNIKKVSLFGIILNQEYNVNNCIAELHNTNSLLSFSNNNLVVLVMPSGTVPMGKSHYLFRAWI